MHFDRALGVHYAIQRSNPMAYLTGQMSDTFADFVKLLGDKPWLDAAPIPGLSLGQNIFYDEYSLVRPAAAEKLPPIGRSSGGPARSACHSETLSNARRMRCTMP